MKNINDFKKVIIFPMLGVTENIDKIEVTKSKG